MNDQPEFNSNNDVAETADNRNLRPQNVDFDLWLEKQLENLEESFKDFATTKSTRNYFSR